MGMLRFIIACQQGCFLLPLQRRRAVQALRRLRRRERSGTGEHHHPIYCITEQKMCDERQSKFVTKIAKKTIKLVAQRRRRRRRNLTETFFPKTKFHKTNLQWGFHQNKPPIDSPLSALLLADRSTWCWLCSGQGIGSGSFADHP